MYDTVLLRVQSQHSPARPPGRQATAAPASRGSAPQPGSGQEAHRRPLRAHGTARPWRARTGCARPRRRRRRRRRGAAPGRPRPGSGAAARPPPRAAPAPCPPRPGAPHALSAWRCPSPYPQTTVCRALLHLARGGAERHCCRATRRGTADYHRPPNPAVGPLKSKTLTKPYPSARRRHCARVTWSRPSSSSRT